MGKCCVDISSANHAANCAANLAVQGGGAFPFPLDLENYWSYREGLNLINTTNIGFDALIYGGTVAVFDGSSDINIGSTNLGKSHTITLEFGDITVSGNHMILGGSTSNPNYIFFSASVVSYRVNNEPHNFGVAIQDNDKLKIVRTETPTPQVSCYVNDILINTVPILEIDNIDFDFDVVGSRNSASYFNGELCCLDLQYSSRKTYFFNGHLFDSESGVEATNNGVTFSFVTSYTPGSTLQGLDRGYTQRSTNQIIYNSSNTKVISDVGGDIEYLGEVFHNFIASRIDFDPGATGDASLDKQDRSNVTIYTANARVALPTGTYDATRPHSFDVLDVDIDLLEIADPGVRFLNNDYFELFYQTMMCDFATRRSIKEIFNYNNNKLLQDSTDVHIYIGNGSRLLKDVLGNYMYTVEGYSLWTP